MPRFRSFAECVAVLSLGLMLTGCAKKACSTCRGDDGGGGWSHAPSQFYSADGYSHDGSLHGHAIEGEPIHGGTIHGGTIQGNPTYGSPSQGESIQGGGATGF